MIAARDLVTGMSSIDNNPFRHNQLVNFDHVVVEGSEEHRDEDGSNRYEENDRAVLDVEESEADEEVNNDVKQYKFTSEELHFVGGENRDDLGGIKIENLLPGLSHVERHEDDDEEEDLEQDGSNDRQILVMNEDEENEEGEEEINELLQAN